MRAGFLVAALAAGFVSLSAATAEEKPASPPAGADAREATAAGASGPVEPAPAKTVAVEKKTTASAKPAATTLVAKIDLSSQTLSLHYDGARRESWSISSGREGFATPRGVFRPQWAAKMWFSRKYDDAPMPNAVFFVGGVAVHGTQATRLLGQPASHGCVRLAPANAARFYNLVHKHGYKHTRIEVFGTPPATRIATRGKAVAAPRKALAQPRRTAAPRLAAGAGMPAYGWIPPSQPMQLRRSSDGIYYLPPNSPYRGRETFVYNGIVYRRVR